MDNRYNYFLDNESTIYRNQTASQFAANHFNTASGGDRDQLIGAYESFAQQHREMRSRNKRGSGVAAEYRRLANTSNAYNRVTNFLSRNRLVTDPTRLTGSTMVGIEDVNEDVDIGTAQANDLDELVEDIGIPEENQEEAADAAVSLLLRARACRNNPGLFRERHFASGDRERLARSRLVGSKVYSAATNNRIRSVESFRDYFNTYGAMEAFGTDVDRVLPDVRNSLTVTLLQFHQGLLNRVMHRKTAPQPYVQYSVPYSEIYDMLLSNDPQSSVRNWGDHIKLFLELYADPGSVTNQLQPIIPLKSNDTANVLYADGFIRPNIAVEKINILDLSNIPNKMGYDHTNYTDLISENVVMSKIAIELTKSGQKEVFVLDVSHLNESRFNMAENVRDSSIRRCFIDTVFQLDNNLKTSNNEASTILASCTATDKLKLSLRVGGEISIKFGDVSCLCAAGITAFNNTGAEVDPTVEQLAKDVTVEVVGYNLDAGYSEENLRKSNLALRYNIRTFDYEISNGRNIMIDYSFQEEVPEFLMSFATEAVSLGQDHRGLNIIVDTMKHVYDRTIEENASPNLHDRLDRISYQYPAGQMVRPVVYLSSIDIDNVDYIRSGDYLGDVRSYVELCLLQLSSVYFQNSFYRQQLSRGENPVFKVISSNIIIDNLFSIPHYHNHLNKDEPTDGSLIEYRRVLPNGVILDCVTTTYNYMRDRIVMIPYVDDPASILSFGGNHDFGTFLAHYNPQMGNAAHKRMFCNARSQVIPTNPSGMYLDVKHISSLINMWQITNPVPPQYATTLPQPSENIHPDTLPKDE